MMEFYAVLDQVVELLRQRGRVTYRALKLQFTLDDNALETLKEELIDAQRLAVDEQGKVLIWTGNAASATPPALGQDQEHVPLAYTPPHLTDKILAARPALEGERKQVTVLFADLKDATELIRGLDPEAAQQLLKYLGDRVVLSTQVLQEFSEIEILEAQNWLPLPLVPTVFQETGGDPTHPPRRHS